MKVRAVRLGYYGLKRKREGEIFELQNPKDFSDAHKPAGKPGQPAKPGWMEKVDDEEDYEPRKRVKKPASSSVVEAQPSAPEEAI